MSVFSRSRFRMPYSIELVDLHQGILTAHPYLRKTCTPKEVKMLTLIANELPHRHLYEFQLQ